MKLPQFAAAMVALIAGVVLIGWAVQVDYLVGVIPGLSTMKPATAVSFLAGAIGLALCARSSAGRWRNPAIYVLSALIATIACVTLADFALGLGGGEGQLPFLEQGSRMSVATAASFLLVALLLPISAHESLVAKRVFSICSLLGLWICFLVLIGYGFGAEILIDPIPESSIAINTAAGFLVLFAGILLLKQDVGVPALLRRKTPGGLIARRLLPWIIVLPAALGWLIVSGVERNWYGAPGAAALSTVVSVLVLLGAVWHGARAADKVHDALVDQEQLHQAVIDTALDGFILMSQDGKVVAWNPQSEKIFGWSAEDAVGKRLSDLIVPETLRDAHERGLRRFLSTGEAKMLRRVVEITAVRRDGQTIPVELIIVPILQEGRWRFSGFVRDISARLAAEEQLHRSQRLQAVGQLTGGVAHDFNNMLTVILGNAELALERAPENNRNLLEGILRAGENGASLTKSLLAFSRQQPLDPERVDVNAFVDATTAMLVRTLGESVQIRLLLADNLWDPAVDRAQLENALINLAINARDAMPEGGKLTIETANAMLDEAYTAQNPDVEPGSYVSVAVTDTGAGMPPDMIERAIEPFFTTKAVGSGTGLGLSMVYGFVKQSGGHIKIYSEVGIGTTVRLYLPRASEQLASPPDSDPSSQVLQRGSEHVLLVEDDQAVRAFTAMRLGELGYRVTQAADAAEALQALAGSDPVDLLFTDMVMPGEMNGRQLAEQAILAHPSLRVLFASGYTEDAILHQGRLEPGVQLLSKPFNSHQLASKVRLVLSGDPYKPH